MHDPAHMRWIKLPNITSRHDEIGGISMDELKFRHKIIAGAAHPAFPNSTVVRTPIAVLLAKVMMESIAAADLRLS